MEAVAESWAKQREQISEMAVKVREQLGAVARIVPEDAALGRGTVEAAISRDAGRHRHAERRLRRGAQVPAGLGARADARRRRAGPGRGHPRRDGRRRHPRPDRRRLRPLLGRRRSGWSRTSRRCSTTTRCSRASTCTATRRSGTSAGGGSRAHPRLGAARDARRGGRLLLGARRRLRGRGGQVLRLDPGADPVGARRRRDRLRRRVLLAYYGVSETGNFEGANILNLIGRLDAPRPELLEEARSALYRARAERVWPGLDDKRLASWNALMIGALAEAGAVLGRADYLDAARGAAEFVWSGCATPRAACCAAGRTARRA